MTEALLRPEERQRLSISMGNRGIAFNSFEDLYRFCTAAADTDFVPADLRGKPMSVLVAAEFCLEIGLPILAGIRNIAVIKGRPTLWGDVMVAMVKASGVMEYDHISYEGTPYEDNYRAVYISKRRGYPEPFVNYFSVADAKRAKLWAKDTYQQFPDRMLLSKARAYQLRDGYADALMGLTPREEAEDIETEPVMVDVDGPRQLPSTLSPEEQHPSVVQIRELQAAIISAGWAKENVPFEMKTHFHITEKGHISQQRWTELITMAHYAEAVAHYEARLKAIVEADIDDHEPPDATISTDTTPRPSVVEDVSQGQPGYATPEQIADLKQLAQQVGDDAYVEVLDMVDHHPQGIVLSTYEMVERRLMARREETGHGAR